VTRLYVLYSSMDWMDAPPVRSLTGVSVESHWLLPLSIGMGVYADLRIHIFSDFLGTASDQNKLAYVYHSYYVPSTGISFLKRNSHILRGAKTGDTWLLFTALRFSL
jgi:hypothetical protein